MRKKRKNEADLIKRISEEFDGTERETSILYDHYDKKVHLETTHTFTARRWLDLLNDKKGIKICDKTDSLKIEVPMDICRNPELIIKPAHRKKDK